MSCICPHFSPHLYLNATIEGCIFIVFFLSEFRLALVQLAVSADKALNICRACEMVKSAVKNGAQMVVLPVRDNVLCVMCYV